MLVFSDFMFHLKGFQSEVLKFFRTLPFYWESLSRRYKTDHRYKSEYLTEFAAMSIYYVYVVVQFIRLTAQGKLTEIDVLYVVFMALTVVMLQNSLVLWKLGESMGLLNKIYYFANRICHDFRKGYDPNKNRRNWLWDKLALMNIIMFSLATLIFSAHFFLFPTDPVYPVCYIVTFPILGPVVYVTFSGLNFYFLCKVMSNLAFTTDNIILSYFVFWELICHETRMGLGKYKLSQNLRRVPNIVYVHRALQLFLGMGLESMGLMFPLTHVIVLKLSLYTQISLIRKWNLLDELHIAILTVSWAIGQTIWLFALHFCGRMVKESKKTVTSWKGLEVWSSKQNTKYMKKFLKSCKPLTISYHNIYVLKRSSILKYMKTVSRGLLRALLAIRSRRLIETDAE